MKNHDDAKAWGKEFQEFMAAPEARPSAAAERAVLSAVGSALNPHPLRLFGKLVAIHTIVGAVTLLFCPQFGMGLGGDAGLMALFMRYGEAACSLGCGAVFVLFTAVAAALALRPEELRVLRRHAPLQFAALALLSSGAFLWAGGAVAETLTMLWLLGFTLTGLVTFHLGARLRIT